jgi:site-specific DNA-cytosine methylase
MFTPVWSNDINERKASVYRANFVSIIFLLGDIKDVDGSQLAKAPTCRGLHSHARILSLAAT